ncbi:hypothetical protein CW717_01635 [Macrococcoides caseolyticum]|nr:hypothetical protein CW719_01635 [Macrococcus caseolyticus]PKF19806.1 hypothetical protein CW717_01635 [Macrococcus caseolyticus]
MATANLGFEEKLWQMADKLRGSMDSGEYKNVVLGLLFLKYVSDAFEEKYQELLEDEWADEEDRDEYAAENIFFVPKEARWSYIKDNAKKPEIGQLIDAAMVAIEKENKSLQGVLPKSYSRPELDKVRLGETIDLFSFKVGDAESRDKDVLGRVYEYFLSKFASAEGKNSGEFYTPTTVVQLLVEMLEPFNGRVYDPACGAGGMFVQSSKFVKEHQGKIDNLSVYGQESNPTTWKLAKMNLAIRGIDSNLGERNADSFKDDLHKGLKADYILANPPFNISDWGREKLSDDFRWKFGLPPKSNANYAWIQHIINHLSPKGKAGFFLAVKSLASKNKDEYKIRKNLIENNLVESIILLPGKLFYSTPAPVCLWIISMKKETENILFIDASKLYKDISRTHRVLTTENIDEIKGVYKKWIKNEGYKDVKGFYKSVNINQISHNDYSLYPGHYIGVEEDLNNNYDLFDCLKNAYIETQKMMNELKDIHLAINTLSKKIQVEMDSIFDNSMIVVTLKDILCESFEVLGNKKEPEILSITENAGLVLQKDRFSKRVATEDTTKYKFVRKNDIVYNPYLLWAGAIDQCRVVDIGITSPAYKVFKIRDEYDPVVIGHILKSEYMEKWYWNISIGSHERRRTAPSEDFLNLKISIPNIEKHKLIKELRKELDSLISLTENIKSAIDTTSYELNRYFTGK